MTAILLKRITEFEKAGGYLWLEGGVVRYRYQACEWNRLHQIVQLLMRHRNEVVNIIAARQLRGPIITGKWEQWLQ